MVLASFACLKFPSPPSPHSLLPLPPFPPPQVYATATEDMDALTFRTPKLLRKLTYSQTAGKGKDGKAREKQPVIELDTEKVLTELGLSYDQFVDLCILCGCDYCSTIKGIGPKTALALIREHKSIENVLKALRSSKKKLDIPQDWKERRVSRKEMVLAEEEARVRREKVEAAKEEGIIKAAASAAAVTGAPFSPSSSSSGALVDTEKDNNEGAGAGAGGCTSAGGEDANAAQDDEEIDDDVPDAPEDDADDVEEEEEVIQLQDIAGEAEDDLRQQEEEQARLEAAEAAIAPDDLEVIPPLYVQARRLFVQAEVFQADTIDLKWDAPDVEGLTAFLVGRMQVRVLACCFRCWRQLLKRKG